MRLNILHILLFLFVVGCDAYSQEIETHISKQQVEVGEPFYVVFKVEIEGKDSINYLPLENKLPVELLDSTMKSSNEVNTTFEIITPYKDTVQIENNTSYWACSYKVIAWDTGYFLIPEPQILKNNIKLVASKGFLHVGLVNQVEGKDIYDISEEYSEVGELKFDWLSFLKKNILWIILAVSVLIFIIIFVLIRRKKSKEVKEIGIQEKTIEAIVALENKKMWLNGNLKGHYVELSFILKSFLANVYQINLLDKTSNETHLLLEQLNLPPDTLRYIEQVFGQSDMVKFAKSNPEETVILRVSELAKNIVKNTPVNSIGNVN